MSKSVSEVTKVTDISMEYITNFILNDATADEVIWLRCTAERCKAEARADIKRDNPEMETNQIAAKASRQYFGAFRAEFAKKFRPELVADKTKRQKKDALADAIAKRLEVLGAVGA